VVWILSKIGKSVAISNSMSSSVFPLTPFMGIELEFEIVTV